MPPARTTAPTGPGVVDALGLLPLYGDEIVLSTVRDTHRAWARRSYTVVNRLTGKAARGPQLLHDGISTAVYTGIGLGLAAGGAALRGAGRRGVGPRLDATPRGRFVRAALNGLVGDRFAEDGSPIAIEMAVRLRGEDVPLDPAHLAAAFPRATGRVVVFLHGLSENEDYWNLHRDRVGSTYPEKLAEQGWTPVMLRANTGLPVRENGVAMAALLRDLVAAWPVGVDRIALVGHSMGGLVSRAACAVVAAEPGERGEGPPSWTEKVSDVVTLGSPHCGAPLAIGVGHGSRLLAVLPETSAFGKILDHRSVGIEDLVDGLGADVGPMPGVRYRLVSAAVTASPAHPVGNLLGDLLVRVPSAYGRSRRRPDLFPDADTLHVSSTDHFGLLNHPEVHAKLEEWLR